MKASELKSMTREELEHELRELREEEFRLRLRRPTEDLPNALRLRNIRRDIARIETTLREDKLGLIQLPRKSERAAVKKEEAPKETKARKKPERAPKKTSAPKKALEKSGTKTAAGKRKGRGK